MSLRSRAVDLSLLYRLPGSLELTVTFRGQTDGGLPRPAHGLSLHRMSIVIFESGLSHSSAVLLHKLWWRVSAELQPEA